MRGGVLVLGADELEEVLLEVEVGRRPVNGLAESQIKLTLTQRPSMRR